MIENCHYSKTDIVKYLNGEMDRKDEIEFQQHLLTCDSCLNHVEKFRSLENEFETREEIENEDNKSSEEDIIIKDSKRISIRRRRFLIYAAAILLLGIIIAGVSYYIHNEKNTTYFELAFHEPANHATDRNYEEVLNLVDGETVNINSQDYTLLIYVEDVPAKIKIEGKNADGKKHLGKAVLNDKYTVITLTQFIDNECDSLTWTLKSKNYKSKGKIIINKN